MKRIEAYVRPNRLEDVQHALDDIGVPGMTCEPVRGYGRQQGQTDTLQGSHYALNLVPKMKISVVVNDDMAEEVIRAITETVQTGELGDGKIFVCDVLDAVRIRTGERGGEALY
ncbi:MAG: P-II family nitrogen regulator [Fimbriimonadaceae bacterium]